MPLSTLGQRVLKILFYGGSLAGMGVAFNMVQLASLVLLPINGRLVSSINAKLYGIVWRTINFAFEVLQFSRSAGARFVANSRKPDQKHHRARITFSGQGVREIPVNRRPAVAEDGKPGRPESAIIVCNHLSFVDWSLINALALRKGMLDHVKYFVKHSMRYIPFFGIGMYLAGFPFLKRNWASDNRKIEAVFHRLKDEQLPCWIVSFIEGTRLTPHKLFESQSFCSARGLPHLSNVLYPRKKGLYATVTALRHSHIKYMYDLTIAYFHEPTRTMNRHFPTLIDMHSNENLHKDWRFHMHLDRFLLEEIPATEDEFGVWIEQRWIEKDKLLQSWEQEWPVPGQNGCYELPYYNSAKFLRFYTASLQEAVTRLTHDGAENIKAELDDDLHQARRSALDLLSACVRLHDDHRRHIWILFSESEQRDLQSVFSATFSTHMWPVEHGGYYALFFGQVEEHLAHCLQQVTDDQLEHALAAFLPHLHPQLRFDSDTATPMVLSGQGSPDDPSAFWPVMDGLRRAGLLERFHKSLSQAMCDATHNAALRLCENDFQEHTLTRIGQVCDRGVLPWLARFISPPDSDASNQWLYDTANQAYLTAVSVFLEHRLAHLWDIIVGYEATMPTVLDIKMCLQKIGGQQRLVEAMRKTYDSFVTDLTDDILIAYIDTIRLMRVIDPTGTLLDASTGKLRKYIRARPDAVKTILAQLVDPETVLKDELEIQEEMRLMEIENECFIHTSGRALITVDKAWVPDPLPLELGTHKYDMGGGYHAQKSHRFADIMSILVSIYNSKDIFMKEYQGMLAQKLLGISDFAAEEEIELLEKLKVRFGDKSLVESDVMVRDMRDSGHLDRLIHEGTTAETQPVHATIISQLYWPEMDESAHALHPDLERHLSTFGSAFSKHRSLRSLEWLKSTGTVELEVELNNGQTADVACTPLEASVLMFFQETASAQSADQIAQALETTRETVVEQGLSKWIKMGIMRCNDQGQYTTVH
ncbi:hypothetical protein RI367_006708 [Sorochytrium milnesiophthora]